MLLLVIQFFSPQTEKYFDMKKTQCKEGLDIYKKFLTRMTRISEFLKVAEVNSTKCLSFFRRDTCRRYKIVTLISLSSNSRWALIEETFQTSRR